MTNISVQQSVAASRLELTQLPQPHAFKKARNDWLNRELNLDERETSPSGKKQPENRSKCNLLNDESGIV